MSCRHLPRQDGLVSGYLRRPLRYALMSLPSGYSVIELWIHEDMRLPSSKAAAHQRSINLAISARGLAAIQTIDPAAAERFLSTVIPMRGRMIHDAQGRLQSQPYDRDGQVSSLATSESLWMYLLLLLPSAAVSPKFPFPRAEIVH